LNITYLQNAGIIVENEGERILCDPWLIDGCYFGAWHHYPKFEFNPKEFENIDYIYISHIHPDHFDVKTLSQLKKDIPVLIHKFPQKYFKANIEELGFNVEEISHNKRTKLNKTWINIVAADNCDPEICSRAFGCNFGFNQFGTNQLDTFSVIDNDDQVIVNTNDCPFEIGQNTAKIIKKQYSKINFLLVGYTGASDYPCSYDLKLSEKERVAKLKKDKRLQNAVDYIQIFNPKYYLPFAGRYVLGGKLTSLMKHKGESTLDEGFNYLLHHVDQQKNKGIVLNMKSYFDLDTELSSDTYIPENESDRENYIQNVLSKLKLDYENDSFPTLDMLLELIPKAYDRFEHHRKMINYFSDNVILIKLNKEKILLIPVNGSGFKIIEMSEFPKFQKYLFLSLDSRLFYKILQTPKKAHWNNAEIGCHIELHRSPNYYSPDIHTALQFLHL